VTTASAARRCSARFPWRIRCLCDLETLLASDDSHELVWVDRGGRRESVGAPRAAYQYPRLSHDHTRLAVVVGGADRNIFMWDFRRPGLQLFTANDPTPNAMVAWSRDGRVAFSSHQSGVRNMLWQASDGSGSPERMFVSPRVQAPVSFAPDGERLLLVEEQPEGRFDVFALVTPKRPDGTDHRWAQGAI
jgi:WD40 repeat protein